MTQATPPVRVATVSDAEDLLRLWGLVFDEVHDESGREWKRNARAWFTSVVDDRDQVRFPVLELDGAIVATAIGTLEIGVPNPHSPRGRLVRLANVVTVPAYRRRGFATAVVNDVVAWSRSIGADRVDLSTTPDGESVYEQLGFVRTEAPRMKLTL